MNTVMYHILLELRDFEKAYEHMLSAIVFALDGLDDLTTEQFSNGEDIIIRNKLKDAVDYHVRHIKSDLVSCKKG